MTSLKSASPENPGENLDLARLSLVEYLRTKPAHKCTNGHQAIARTLAAFGVTHVYGIPGAPVDATFAACRQAGLKLVTTRHQQAAVYAAAAHNWIVGALKAVVIVSAGPGVTNCTSGLTVARDNGWPLLVIGGRRNPLFDDRGGFQVLDGATLFASIARTSSLIETTHDVAKVIEELLLSSVTGRPAPCYAEVLTDALEGFEPEPAGPIQPPSGNRATPTESEVLKIFANSVRPLLILGDDLRFGPGFAAAKHLAEKCGMPWITSSGLRGLVPESHPMCATPVRHQLLATADCILMLGARLDWTLRHGVAIQESTRVLRLGRGNDPAVQDQIGSIDHDCDPSPATIALSQRLNDGLSLSPIDEGYLELLAQSRRQLQSSRDTSRATTSEEISPAQLMYQIGQVVPDNCRIILDGNLSMAWADRMLDVEAPLLRLTSGMNGCLGVGVPFGIAACLAAPGTRVLLIVGDFALGVALQDLETVVRYRLPLTIVLANNCGNAGRLRETEYYGDAEHADRVYQFTEGIRYDQIMTAMGGRSEHVSTLGGVSAALQRAFDSNDPTLLQIDIQDDALFPEF